MRYRQVKKRNLIRALLTECTPEQLKRFNDLFGEDINMIPAKNLGHAIRICERTVHMNWGVDK